MSKFSKISLANEARVELKEKLGLTSCEVSLNELPAGAEVPFTTLISKMKSFISFWKAMVLSS